MATSWSQRKALGRRYSVDPALQYELARLQYEYNLAPTRSAQAAQREQFTKSQAQQESQYARGLELQRQKMAMESEQYNKSLAAQQEQFYASMAEAQRNHDAQMALAQQQYQLAAQTAKDEKELALAQQRLAEQQFAANQQLQQDQIKAQEQAALYGTVGNVAMLGSVAYGKDLFGAAKGLFGGGTTAASTAPSAATGMSGVTGGQTIGAGTPTFTTNPNLLYGSPATTDVAAGAGGFGGGTVAPTVTPAGMTTTPASAIAPTGISGGATDYAGIAGSADASWAAQQSAINQGLAAGADVGIGYGDAIGSGISAGADVGMGAGGATWGTALGTLGSAVSTAVPYVGAATIGMPILGNVLERGFESAFGIEPGSSNVFAQANTITGENFHRPIEAATNLLGIKTPEWVEAIFNPGGWALGALGLCFLAGTKVEMEDGTTKNVEDIKIGDRMKEGGMVTGRGEHLSGDLYDYQGVKVTGSHAVFDGEWMRVENTLKATQIALKEPVTVYIIDNQHHKIIIDGITFADFTEVDGSENMLPEDRIHHMNRRDGVKIQAYDHPFHYRRSHRENRMQANPIY